ncbi:hypothetical protein [Aerosakkonema funiforme]|uniref:hypothetical protein n=1 Tax=Aerosakkonema funiforme TaxID=1246630 RepID=UPI0035B91323
MSSQESVGEYVAKKALGTAAAMGVVFLLGTVFSGGNPLVGAAAAKVAGVSWAVGGGHGSNDENTDFNDLESLLDDLMNS